MVKIEVDNEQRLHNSTFQVIVEFNDRPNDTYDYDTEHEAVTFAMNKTVNESHVTVVLVERHISYTAYSFRRTNSAECE